MKKTLIALSLFTVSSSVFAAKAPEQYSLKEVQEYVTKHYNVAEAGNGAVIVEKNFNSVSGPDFAAVKETTKGKIGTRTFEVKDSSGKVHTIKADSKGNIVTVNNERVTKPIDQNGMIKDDVESRTISRVTDLEQAAAVTLTDLERQAAQFEQRLDKLDQRMDGVMAGTHAINNARPFVQNGQTAFGVGTGFAGSAQAVAVGFAHSFEDSAWSMSATTNISTGSKIKTEASFGAGVQYAF